jgi:hypothetical protein
MGTWVLYECALLALMVAYVLFWVKIGYFEFLILWCNVEYYVSMLFSIDSLVLYWFLVVCAFRHSVVDSLVVFLFVILYWYAFMYWSFVYGAVSWFSFFLDVVLLLLLM